MCFFGHWIISDLEIWHLIFLTRQSEFWCHMAELFACHQLWLPHFFSLVTALSLPWLPETYVKMSSHFLLSCVISPLIVNTCDCYCLLALRDTPNSGLSPKALSQCLSCPSPGWMEVGPGKRVHSRGHDLFTAAHAWFPTSAEDTGILGGIQCTNRWQDFDFTVFLIVLAFAYALLPGRLL